MVISNYQCALGIHSLYDTWFLKTSFRGVISEFLLKKETKKYKEITWEEFIEKESKLLKNIVKYEEYKPYQQKLQIDLSYEWKR